MGDKHKVAIIDFGSSTIHAAIAERGSNNTFKIHSKHEMEYEGYFSGEFLNYGELAEVLRLLTQTVFKSTKVSQIFVGVPGAFCTVLVKDAMENFSAKRKILQADIDDLMAQEGNVDRGAYKLINRAPVYFTLEDGNYIDPRNYRSSFLKGRISYIYSSTYFLNTVTDILNRLGYGNLKFMSSNLCQGYFLTTGKERDEKTFVLDVGYLTTCVYLLEGEGISFMRSFSLGGGTITADLMTQLNIPFSAAEKIKRQVSLSLLGDGSYTVTDKGKTFSFDIQIVNDIVRWSLSTIAKNVNNCVSLCKEDFSPHALLYLTGGGISYIRGAREKLSKILGKIIEQGSCKIEQYDDPKMSSVYGLMDKALDDITLKKSLLDFLR